MATAIEPMEPPVSRSNLRIGELPSKKRDPRLRTPDSPMSFGESADFEFLQTQSLQLRHVLLFFWNFRVLADNLAELVTIDGFFFD